jgi:hypothetical protein
MNNSGWDKLSWLEKLKLRYYALEEVWQRGYSREYRMYRLKEALGLKEPESYLIALERAWRKLEKEEKQEKK